MRRHSGNAGMAIVKYLHGDGRFERQIE